MIIFIFKKGCARVQNSKLYSLISNNDVEVKFSIHEFKNIENVGISIIIYIYMKYMHIL